MVTVNKKSAAVIAGIVLLLMQSPMPAWASDAVNSDVTQASDSDFKSLGQLDLGGSNQPPATKEDLLASRKQYKENLKKYNKDLKKAESEYNKFKELVDNAIKESGQRTTQIDEIDKEIDALNGKDDSESEKEFNRLIQEKEKLDIQRKTIEKTLTEDTEKLKVEENKKEEYGRYVKNTEGQISSVNEQLKSLGVNIDELDKEENKAQEETIKPDSPAPAPRTESDATVDTPNDSTKSKEEVEKSIPEVKSPETKVTEEKAVQEKDSVQTQPKDSKVDSRSSDNKFASSEYRSSQVESLESKKSKAKSVEAESTTSSSVAARPAESSVTPFAPVSEPKVVPQNATSKETPAVSVENSQNASTVSPASAVPAVSAASANVSTPAAPVAPVTHSASAAPAAAQPASPVSHPAESEANNASSSEKSDSQNNEEDKKDENAESEEVKEDSKTVDETNKLSEAKSDNSKAPSNNNNLVIAGAVVGTMAIGGSAAAGIYMSRGGKIRFSK
ncbi:conjugal transfer protein [Gardnerella sp. DNF00354]|uniref:conjugal transfer protein n=1 Tax=Gardnerella sp. DNF00354 TaxID=2749046 RepID=UPI003BB0FEFD